MLRPALSAVEDSAQVFDLGKGSAFQVDPCLGWFNGDANSDDLRTLADLTLALILFIDAANADMTVLKRQFRIPSRMLLLGLPGVIALGFGLATWPGQHRICHHRYQRGSARW